MPLSIGRRPVGSLRHAGALCFLAPMRTATTRRCTRRWRNFAKYTGDQSLLSFVARDVRPQCPKSDARFFVTVLKGQLLQHANPARGRFRSLVLKALPDFLRDAETKRCASKRGSEMRFVPWDDWMAEAPSHFSISQQESEGWPAERIFDVRWAATMVERALSRLGEECERRGRRRVFDMLSPCLAAERDDVSYSKFSKNLRIPVASVKRLVHQLRVRYRALLREEVGRTVEKPDEIDHELRYLSAALTAAE